MGLNYVNLDDRTRSCMIAECALGPLYESPRMHGQGKAAWPAVFEEAITKHNDDWLAGQIIVRRMLSNQEQYKAKNGQTSWRNVNIEFSAQILAQGEFNRYYLRWSCSRRIRH
jgi:hypothetical protein